MSEGAAYYGSLQQGSRSEFRRQDLEAALEQALRDHEDPFGETPPVPRTRC